MEDALPPLVWETLDLLHTGMSNREMAGQLHLSENAVRSRMKNLMWEAGKSTRQGVVGWSMQRGLYVRDLTMHHVPDTTEHRKTIIWYFGEGYCKQEVANAMNLEADTIRTHVSIIFRRWRVHSLHAMVGLAYRAGVL